MRNYFFVFVYVLCLLSSEVQAQKISIDDLLSTDVEFSGEVMDGHSVFGYLFLYSKGKVDKENTKMHYRFLDQNLNLVVDGDFVTRNDGEYFSARRLNDRILILKNNGPRIAPTLDVTAIFLPLSADHECTEMVYSKGKMVPFSEIEPQKHKLFSTGGNIRQVYRVFESGDRYFLFAQEVNNDGKENRRFDIFDDQLQSIFHHELKIGDKKEYSFLQFKGITDNFIIMTESTMQNPFNLLKRELLLFSTKDFRLLSRSILEDKGGKNTHQLRFREHNGQLYQSAFYSKFGKTEYFNIYKSQGLYLMIYDETGKRIHEKYTIWKDLDKRLGIGKSGRYGVLRERPSVADFHPLGRDAIYYLFAQSKEERDSRGGKVRIIVPNQHKVRMREHEKFPVDIQLYGFFLDDKLKVPKAKEFSQVEKMADLSNLIFSQRISDGQGLFFVTYQKTDLFKLLKSNTKSGFTFYNVNKDGVQKTSKFNRLQDGIEIWPYRGKSGYVLISEKNISARKYNVRLERIDF